MSEHSNTPGNLPQLTATNFSYWYDALEIHACTVDAHAHLTDQIAAPVHATQQTSHQRKADQIRKAIMQSLSPDVVKLLHPTYSDMTRITYARSSSRPSTHAQWKTTSSWTQRHGPSNTQSDKTSTTTSQNTETFDTACKYHATPTLTPNALQSDTWSKDSLTTPTCTPSQSYSCATPPPRYGNLPITCNKLS